MKERKSVREVIDGMKEEYQTYIRNEFENMHMYVRTGDIDKAMECSDLLDKHKRDAHILGQLIYRLEQEANIE
jgi:hypothetical protein